jgi:hypothetical protein
MSLTPHGLKSLEIGGGLESDLEAGKDGELRKRESSRTKSMREKRQSKVVSTILPILRPPEERPEGAHIHAGIDEVLHVFDLHAPTQKYTWNEEHTKVFRNGGHLEEHWLNEFLDLILVAALIKLGDGMYYCGLTMDEYFFVCVEFFLLFKTRYQVTESS